MNILTGKPGAARASTREQEVAAAVATSDKRMREQLASEVNLRLAAEARALQAEQAITAARDEAQAARDECARYLTEAATARAEAETARARIAELEAGEEEIDVAAITESLRLTLQHAAQAESAARGAEAAAKERPTVAPPPAPEGEYELDIPIIRDEFGRLKRLIVRKKKRS